MNAKRWTLEWIPGTFAIARYDGDEPMPPWALDSHILMTVTRTHDELSIIAPDHNVPFNAQAERGFVAMRVVEPLDFKQVGVIATLTRALADAGISILAVSTYETDVILFREEHKDAAREALSAVADTSRL
ncbi:MAG: ACT domain-containing protein [Candidatus Hydrogenedentes bacterium]|nr:ACT domain-containing protein [Candidatus Hydrogenedentota bacterium]